MLAFYLLFASIYWFLFFNESIYVRCLFICFYCVAFCLLDLLHGPFFRVSDGGHPWEPMGHCNIGSVLTKKKKDLFEHEGVSLAVEVM